MHRIDTPTAQIDKFGQGRNGFTNGDPSTGRRATDLNSDMWDAVQEELANAIEKSGLALNKNRHDQLYQAVKKIISDDINDRALLKWNNLSDLSDKSTSRNNLSVYSKAESDGAFAHKSGDRIQWLDVTDGLAVGKNVVVDGDVYIDGHDYVTKRGTNNTVNNERGTSGYRIRGGSDLFADIFHNERIGINHYLGIHVANGGADGWFEFRNDGSFWANGGASFGSNIHVSWGGRTATYQENGDVHGTVWGGALSSYINGTFVSDIRLVSRGVITTDGGMNEAPWGAVITGGNGNEGNQVGQMFFRYLQKKINNNWYTVAYE
ncbi:hypothetical protein [Erwinia pyrifoliae]|uniref:Phage tail protein n=1 Tax=Erwinia pyrifoliae TaxID=79967 RepID=A0ABY5X419_ERWPY|nr:hypothetical protein [Erwinia pyrifoliae]UWS31932.1 phage tail protein [Erwinia pyrifoliae]UXK13857.1 phage tail protein [Erwinia pyrifoliae]CAX55814.1 Putative tail fiber protein [Erwinia pyrifoliae Ep1/96]